MLKRESEERNGKLTEFHHRIIFFWQMSRSIMENCDVNIKTNKNNEIRRPYN